MVQIPDFKLNPGQIPDNAIGPSVYPGYSDRLGAGIEKLGNAVDSVATNLAETRKKAQDASSAHQASLQDKLDLEDYSNQLKTSLPKSMDGYSDAIQQWTQDRMQSNLESMPSEGARQQYQSLAGSLFTGEIVSAKSQEFKQKAISYGQDMITMKDALANAQERNPDPKSAADSIQRHNLAVDSLTGTVFSQEDSFKLKKTAQNEIAKGTVDGFYSRAENDDKNWNTWAKQGLAVIYGKDGESQRMPDGQKLRDYLTPDETGSYIRKFQSFIDQKKQTNAVEVRRSADDAVVNALNGLPVSPDVVAGINKAVSDGSIKPEEALRTKNKIMAAQATSDTISQLKTAPSNQFQSIIASNQAKVAAATAAAAGNNPSLKSAKNPGYNSAETNQYNIYIQNQAAQIMKDRAEDPVSFTTSQPQFAYVKNQMHAAGWDPDKSQAAVVSLLAAQDRQGIPPSAQRVTSKSDTAQIGQMLSQTDPDQSTKAFTQLEQKYGNYWPQAFNEAFDDKNVDSSLWLAHYVQNPDQRQKMVAMISNKKVINAAYEKDHPEKADHDQLRSAVTSELRDHLDAINQISDKGGSLELSNGFRDFVETGARNELVSNPSLSADDAAKKAAQMVKSNYQTVGAANSKIIAPANENKRVISTFMEENLSNPPMDRFAMPSGDLPQGMSPDDAKNRYAEVISKTGRWESTPTMDGVRLVRKLPDGSTRLVMKKDGTPFSVKFSDMIHDKPTADALDKKGVFRQILETGIAPENIAPDMAPK